MGEWIIDPCRELLLMHPSPIQGYYRIYIHPNDFTSPNVMRNRPYKTGVLPLDVTAK